MFQEREVGIRTRKSGLSNKDITTVTDTNERWDKLGEEGSGLYKLPKQSLDSAELVCFGSYFPLSFTPISSLPRTHTHSLYIHPPGQFINSSQHKDGFLAQVQPMQTGEREALAALYTQ